MSSQRSYPRLSPLQINHKNASPSKSHTRDRSSTITSATSDPSFSPDGSLHSASTTSTYPDSASAAHIAAEFLAEVDSWIIDIRQQLDELEARHEQHREWLAKGGADALESDVPSSEIKSANHRSAEAQVDKNDSESASGSPVSFFSLFTRRPSAKAEET